MAKLIYADQVLDKIADLYGDANPKDSAVLLELFRYIEALQDPRSRSRFGPQQKKRRSKKKCTKKTGS